MLGKRGVAQHVEVKLYGQRLEWCLRSSRNFKGGTQRLLIGVIIAMVSYRMDAFPYKCKCSHDPPRLAIKGRQRRFVPFL
jgi:hypothetical protein